MCHEYIWWFEQLLKGMVFEISIQTYFTEYPQILNVLWIKELSRVRVSKVCAVIAIVSSCKNSSGVEVCQYCNQTSNACPVFSIEPLWRKHFGSKFHCEHSRKSIGICNYWGIAIFLSRHVYMFSWNKLNQQNAVEIVICSSSAISTRGEMCLMHGCDP